MTQGAPWCNSIFVKTFDLLSPLFRILFITPKLRYRGFEYFRPLINIALALLAFLRPPMIQNIWRSMRGQAKNSVTNNIAPLSKPDDEKDGPERQNAVNGKKRRKEDSSEEEPLEEAAGLTAPATPKRRRKAATLTTASPITPTPTVAGIVSSPRTHRDIHDVTSSPPPAKRPAEPHHTNATLISPETSRIVAYWDGDHDLSPSKGKRKHAKTTTLNILDEAVAHLLKVDPKLKTVIDQHPCRIFTPEALAEEIDPFQSLASGIIGQQVSGAAAKAIKNRFVALFSPSDNTEDEERLVHAFPTPSQVVKMDIATLRTAGLSQRKAEYIKGLAEKFASKELSAELLLRASDEEVMEKLIAVRGLGRWSVEMFACFGLKRMDVFSTGDLGVQ